jgi:hypothetical protein
MGELPANSHHYPSQPKVLELYCVTAAANITMSEGRAEAD